MNKIILGLIWVGMLLFNSCTKDKAIGEIGHLTSDYVLPQGKSPADDRIVELYKKYGSYFLYEFSKRDFDWKLINTSLGEYGDPDYDYRYAPADPNYMGDMLDFLNDIWFRFYSEQLLKKMIPFRVMFVAKLERKLSGYEEEWALQYFRIEKHQFVFSCCSEELKEMPKEKKEELRKNLQSEFLSFCLQGGIMNLPDKFYKISDYSFPADNDPESEDYARKRGFFPSKWDDEGDEWYISLTGREGDRPFDMQHDIYSFLYKMLRTSEEWKEDLTWPLVKQKYELLQNYFKDNYGIDFQAMGDADYE